MIAFRHFHSHSAWNNVEVSRHNIRELCRLRVFLERNCCPALDGNAGSAGNTRATATCLENDWRLCSVSNYQVVSLEQYAGRRGACDVTSNPIVYRARVIRGGTRSGP